MVKLLSVLMQIMLVDACEFVVDVSQVGVTTVDLFEICNGNQSIFSSFPQLSGVDTDRQQV